MTDAPDAPDALDGLGSEERPESVPENYDERLDLLDQRDTFLMQLVDWTNGGMGMEVVLHVGGHIVSGKLISGADYFKGIRKEFFEGSSPSEEYAANLDKLFEPWMSLYDKDRLDELRMTYLHLGNARAFGFGANPIPNNKGVFWRGKLSSVDAFHLGSLAAVTERA